MKIKNVDADEGRATSPLTYTIFTDTHTHIYIITFNPNNFFYYV